MTKIIEEQLINNYKTALKQKYNAVCFDIDGTLTEENSKHIDYRVIKFIADLLRQKVPIVFITGRGETGLNDMVNEIVPVLKNEYGITDKELSRMYALLNDGARLFRTTKDSNKIFNNRVYLSSVETLDSLEKFNTEIISYFEKTKLSEYCNITYSYDNTDGRIVNMRFNLNSENEKTNKKIYEIINELVSKASPSITITRGLYEGKTKIQIGTTKKDLAIETAERLIGVPKNSMLRIGDCGDINGNDFEMLDCAQGFSVRETSDKKDCCFPIIDDNYNVLTGVEATILLLKKAKILPTICLESANEKEYRKGYALVEKMINIGRQRQLEKYNEIFNDVFSEYGGVENIFDSASGSIKIPMYEWELIDDENPLKNFWNITKNGNLSYSLRDDNNFLLRGSSTYYYFLANRINTYDDITGKEKDFTSLENVLDWLSNYKKFLIDAMCATNQINDLNDISNKKMILGILDNIRNILLINMNETLCNNYGENSVILNLEKLPGDNEIKKMYDTLVKVHISMMESCLNQKYTFNIHELNEIFDQTINLIESKEGMLLSNGSKEKDYSKDFRTYREIDNFAENFITVSLVNDKNGDEIFGMCGLSYGGIELPIIYKALNKTATDILLLKFSKGINGYATKHSVEVRNFDVSDYGGVTLFGFNPNKKYIIADDNLLTAKTMQLAFNTFYDLGIKAQGALVVRYPSINRVGQMFMKNHGAVDFNYFFDYIQGLCFPSPYSFRDEHDGNEYLDSLGIFDVNRRKIIECLYKNHDYSEPTEVSRLKR